MTDPINYRSQITAAKVVGVTFLVLLASGIFSNFFVDAKIIVDGDAVATAHNILASETLFRTGIASGLIMFNCDVILAIAFYVLLKPVNKYLALLGAFWRFANACIGAYSIVNKFRALNIVHGQSYLNVFGKKQLHALMMLFLNDNAGVICLIFFSAGMAVHGYLLFKSKYIPQILSGFYLFAALVIFICSFLLIIFPGAEEVISPAYVVPDFFAELIVALWFLFKGIKMPRIAIL